MLVTAPRPDARYPAVLMFSDIFQITGPQRRVSARLAGYGFVVATPEIWNRVEAPGSAIPFDNGGRTRGLENRNEPRWRTWMRIAARRSSGCRPMRAPGRARSARWASASAGI